MAVDGVTLAARTALAAAITAAGVTCRKYPAWDVKMGSIATLGTPRWELGDGYDQSYGIRTIVFPVRLYQVVGANVEASLARADTALENVIDGICADRTLGRKVVSSEVGSDVVQEHYREANGQTYTVTSIEVRVAPHPNAAS